MRRGFLALALGAMLGASSMAPGMVNYTSTECHRRTAPRATGGAYRGKARYKLGPGWSIAQVKRMAKKRHNQLRHKRACQGKKG